MKKQRFQIKGMHCVGCAMTIDNALEDMPGIKSASTSYAKAVVEVEYDENKVNTSAILNSIEKAGYFAILMR